MYQNQEKYTRCPQNIPKPGKIYQMSRKKIYQMSTKYIYQNQEKYTRCPRNIPNPGKNIPNIHKTYQMTICMQVEYAKLFIPRPAKLGILV
jgi:hypothetical protein